MENSKTALPISNSLPSSPNSPPSFESSIRASLLPPDDPVNSAPQASTHTWQPNPSIDLTPTALTNPWLPLEEISDKVSNKVNGRETESYPRNSRPDLVSLESFPALKSPILSKIDPTLPSPPVNFPEIHENGNGKKHEIGPWKKLFSSKAEKSASTKIEFHSPILSDIGTTDAEFAMEDFEEERWSNCLFGYFIGRKPYFSALKDHLIRKWKLKGEFQMSVLPNNFFLFKFFLEEDCTKVLEGPITTYGGRALILQRWYPGCPLHRSKLSKLPIWIKFPALHLKYWSAKGLGKLASTIGMPLYMDTQTAEASRLGFARVCIEVFPDSPLPDHVRIHTPTGIEIQPVEYDWKPFACKSCQDFGHSLSRCPMTQEVHKQVQKQEWIPKSQVHPYKPDKRKTQVLITKTSQNLDSFTPCASNKFSTLADVEEEHSPIISCPPEKVRFPPVNLCIVATQITKSPDPCSLENIPVAAETIPLNPNPIPNQLDLTNSPTPIPVYAHNYHIPRRSLWSNLEEIASRISRPWLVAGDFNVVRFQNERLGGSLGSISEMEELNSCIANCFLDDLFSVGHNYTWSNKQVQRKFAKLDRVDLDHIQSLIASNPGNSDLYPAEENLCADLKIAMDKEENFLRQKSRIQWLNLGDSNSKFFYSSIKSRQNRNNIRAILRADGSSASDPKEIAQIFVAFFNKVLNNGKS
ncbi:uncharacterized protein LOC143861362 [Tasmannia lanceolata]|uniref:uncharacterized protein LOC143861362 n=1 Tax=Tasmannia lanceolata TaxID=3420 RepID=UPI0040637B1D